MRCKTYFYLVFSKMHHHPSFLLTIKFDYMEKYIVVQWPDIQTYMNKEGFEDNAHLINDEKGIELFGSSAYFINEEWADKVDSIDVLWREISAALADTSEENHMKVNIIVSTPEDQGLSDNDKPVITEIWQQLNHILI